MTAAVYLRISQDRTGQRAGVQRQQEDRKVAVLASEIACDSAYVPGLTPQRD